MTTAEDVLSIIFGFTKRCFIGETSTAVLNSSNADGLFKLLQYGDFDHLRASQLNQHHKALLKELLTQYIMFLQQNAGLPFPPNFLEGSNEDNLGRPLLDYICEYKWPYPQLLNAREI